jgi:hypothetical protein
MFHDVFSQPAAPPGRRSQPRLVDERRRLQGVPRLLARHLRTGEFAQLGIDQWKQLLPGASIAVLDRCEEPRHIARHEAVAKQK